MNEQLARVVTLIRNTFADDLAGAYVYGSATAGGLRPTSDIDVLAVLRRRTTPEERRRLIDALLDLSMRPRYLEVTLVVGSDVRPWRYPPRMELQYGDWWRSELERGLEPWPEENPDLATLLTMVLQSGRTLHGPPPQKLLDPIPIDDVVRSATDDLDELLARIESDTRNVLLTLARVWVTAATDEIRTKAEAAVWALERLDAPALARAHDLYEEGTYGPWDNVDPGADAERLIAEISAAGAGR